MTLAGNRASHVDAGLPVIDYDHAEGLDAAHDIIRQAREKAPIAIGLRGPEILSYELVRTVLRDPRFRVPQAMSAGTPPPKRPPSWPPGNRWTPTSTTWSPTGAGRSPTTCSPR